MSRSGRLIAATSNTALPEVADLTATLQNPRDQLQNLPARLLCIAESDFAILPSVAAYTLDVEWNIVIGGNAGLWLALVWYLDRRPAKPGTPQRPHRGPAVRVRGVMSHR